MALVFTYQTTVYLCQIAAKCLVLLSAFSLSACSESTIQNTQTTSAVAPTNAKTADRPPPNSLRNAYFGDLHLHTRNSYDAYIVNVRATPEATYTYANRRTIKHVMGFDLKLHSGPLDFLAVTDHAEYIGLLTAVNDPTSPYAKISFANDLFASDRAGVFRAFGHFVDCLISGQIHPELADMTAPKSAWQETILSAEYHYQPGKFTSFIGYEFTSLPGVRNLLRTSSIKAKTHIFN